MAISEPYATSASIGTTEYSLTNNSTSLQAVTTDGFYQLWLGLNAMAAGDQYQVRIYEKVLSSGTQRVAYEAILTGVQYPPHFPCPTLILINGWEMTLKKLAGTDRTLEWSIRQA